MHKFHPVYKLWAPQWLIWVTILLVIIPAMGVFAIATAGSAQAMGYYGATPADIQFSMLVFYVAVTTFPPLEQHFFARFAIKDYFFFSTTMMMVTLYGSFSVRDIHLLLCCRFLNGIFNGCLVNIGLTMMFNRLKSEYAREVGYSVFYGMILASSLFTSWGASLVDDNVNYNVVYRWVILSFIPGLVLFFFITNNRRFAGKQSLVFFRLPWVDFVLYSIFVLLISFVLIYGQQYDWYDDLRIRWGTAGIVVFGGMFVVRNIFLEHKFIDLRIFTHRRFLFGVLMLICLYLVRGAFNITTNYFSVVLGMDTFNVYQLSLYNLLGIVAGTFASGYLVVRKFNMKAIWLAGFLLMLVFYGGMAFRFSTNADAGGYIMLLIVQGMGQGFLMTPIVLFIISSVPHQISTSASSAGIFVRFTTFSLSIALISYTQLAFTKLHANRLSHQLTGQDGAYVERIRQTARIVQYQGVLPDKASAVAAAMVNRDMQKEVFVEFAVNYYQWTAAFIIFIILLILLQPSFKWLVINVKGNKPIAAGF